MFFQKGKKSKQDEHNEFTTAILQTYNRNNEQKENQKIP